MAVDVWKFAQELVAASRGKTLPQLRSEAGAAFLKLDSAHSPADAALLDDYLADAWRERYGVAKITVVSAHPLTVNAQAMLKTFAKGAEVKEIVDSRLLGGAVIRVDDRRLDGSVLGALTRLRQTLLD